MMSEQQVNLRVIEINDAILKILARRDTSCADEYDALFAERKTLEWVLGGSL